MKLSSNSNSEEKVLTLAEFEKFKQELELKLATKEDKIEATKFQNILINQLQYIRTILRI